MADVNISAEIAEAQKLEDLTGMGMPEELKEAYKLEEESEVNSKPAPKEETEEVESTETEEETDDDSKDEVEDKESKIRSPKPAKNERPLKAIFSQIKELRNGQESLATIIKGLQDNSTKKETVNAIDEISTLAEKRGLDAEGLAEIISLAQKKVLEDLEKNGKLSNKLSPEVEERLKLLDELQAERKVQAEVEHFNKEYVAYLPELQKQYPNAKAAELAEAKVVLDELAHSKEFRDKDLDYVVYKNRSKFDALLKVAKHSKSGETSSKQMVDDTDEEFEIDLDPENMTPEKAKAYEKGRLNRN